MNARIARPAVSALLLAAAVLPLALPTEAEARRGYYVWRSEHARPVHGYSGWVGAGPRSYYCDYQRLPNRECTTTRSGKESCRIVSWTLRQHCY